MPDLLMTEHRSGPRYVAAFPVRAEWDTADGAHVVSEGETENVGPEGTLIHLQRELPRLIEMNHHDGWRRIV